MTDGVLNIADTEFGKRLSRLAGLTVETIHGMIAEDESFRRASNGSLTTYMLNENMIFMQFVQGLMNAHTDRMSRAYQRVNRINDKR